MALFDAAVAIPLVTIDHDAYLAALGEGLFYDVALAVPVVSTPLVVVADLPVEWDGSFDLVFTWDTIQRLLSDLVFAWTEVAASPIFNNALPFTWNELDNLVPLVFGWTELPANLLAAYELDPQKPYGRVSKP